MSYKRYVLHGLLIIREWRFLMKLTQIFFQNQNTLNCYVNYENKLLPRYVFEDDIHKKIFQKHTESIMLKVEEAISEYVNCENLCNDDEGMFPQPKFMTGEWYIGTVCFEDYYLGIETRFIGIDTGKKDDYLGLAVAFDYNAQDDEFLFDGINSESI